MRLKVNRSPTKAMSHVAETMYSSEGAGSGGEWYEIAKLGGFGGKEGIVRVLVEGPYSGLGNTVFASYFTATLIVGRSGVFFAPSVIEDFLQLDEPGMNAPWPKTIDVIWAIQEPALYITKSIHQGQVKCSSTRKAHTIQS